MYFTKKINLWVLALAGLASQMQVASDFPATRLQSEGAQQGAVRFSYATACTAVCARVNECNHNTSAQLNTSTIASTKTFSEKYIFPLADRIKPFSTRIKNLSTKEKALGACVVAGAVLWCMKDRLATLWANTSTKREALRKYFASLKGRFLGTTQQPRTEEGSRKTTADSQATSSSPAGSSTPVRPDSGDGMPALELPASQQPSTDSASVRTLPRPYPNSSGRDTDEVEKSHIVGSGDAEGLGGYHSQPIEMVDWSEQIVSGQIGTTAPSSRSTSAVTPTVTPIPSSQFGEVEATSQTLSSGASSVEITVTLTAGSETSSNLVSTTSSSSMPKGRVMTQVREIEERESKNKKPGTKAKSKRSSQRPLSKQQKKKMTKAAKAEAEKARSSNASAQPEQEDE